MAPDLKYLLDTNIWLERLLDQEHSEEVGRLLHALSKEQIILSDFTLHSIGVILGRLGAMDLLAAFLEDLFENGSVEIATLTPANMKTMADVMKRFSIDFDDAYHYVAAKEKGVSIVSYDKDFDKTDCKRLTPESMMNTL